MASSLHLQLTSLAKLSTDISEWDEERIREAIASCSFAVIKWQPLIETDEGKSRPVLSHNIVNIECVYRYGNELLSNQYRRLRVAWSNIKTDFPSGQIPWLTFVENAAFSQELVQCHCSDSVTGLFLGTLAWPSSLICHFDFLSAPNELCKAFFYHDVKYMELLFKGHKLRVHYSNIRNIIVKDTVTEATLFLNLENPPFVFRKVVLNRKNKIVWERIVTYPGLAKCILGCSSILALTLKDAMYCWKIVSRIHIRCNKMPVHCVNMTIVEDNLHKTIPRIDLEHFGSLYLISGLLYRSFVIWYQYNGAEEFIQQLRCMAYDDPMALEKVLTDVFYAMDQRKVFNYSLIIKSLFDWYKANRVANSTQSIIPEKTCPIRRITVTPTRILLWPPEIMFENRILRNFDSEYALRVLFRDDDYMKLNNNSYTDSAVYESTIEHIAKKGILLGNRKYQFMAWSNSQIRDHGVWFYAKDHNGYTAEAIRSWMGDFSGIKSVPKFMARMGQCFSHTIDTISVPFNEEHIRTEEDILGGRHPLTNEPYCFSDGIGRISACAAEKVCSKLGLSKIHSAFQIRYAGYKGVLCLDPYLEDVEIVFRESMKKFECQSMNKLEIVQVSKPMPVALNRPLIAILEHLGVPKNTFLMMQQNMLQALTDMLLEEDKAVE